MTEQCTCRGLRITDKSPGKLFRTRRLQSLGQLTAGQIFINRHAFSLGAEQFANDMFHGLVVGRKDRVSQQFSNFGLQWRDEPHGFVSVRGLRRDPHVDLSRQREHAHGGVAGVRDQMADLVVHGAFTNADDLQNPIVNHFREIELPAQIGLDFILKQPLHLHRHAGQGENHAPGIFDNETGRRAIGILHRNGAFGHIRLPPIIRRHGPATASKMLFDLFQKIVVEHQLPSRNFGDDLACQVVLRGTEPPAGDDDIRPLQRPLNDLFHPSGVVANDRLEIKINAQRSQSLRHPGGIGVDDLAEEQLGSDSNDFRIRHWTYLLRPDLEL